VSTEELARIEFSFARSEDVDGYRGLYLNGAAAVWFRGEETTKVYLERRTSARFEEADDQFFERVTPGARFEKGSLTEKDVVELWVFDSDGRKHKIPIGTIMHVGAIMRLAAPVTEIEASSAIEHLRQ
jgi:hypothetical protein